MPGDEIDAVISRKLDLFDAVESGLRRRDAGGIWKIHEHAVAEIDCDTDERIERGEA